MKYYLKIDGVAGNTAYAPFKGAFDIKLASFGLSTAAQIGGGGGGIQKSFSPLQLQFSDDASLTTLAKLIATGANKNATLSGVTDNGAVVYNLDLGNSVVTSYKKSDASGLTASFDYVQIKLATSTIDLKGSVASTNNFTWDLVTNQSKISNINVSPAVGSIGSSQASKYFMLVDGMNGGSLDSKHKGWFEISNLDFSMTSSASAVRGDTGSLSKQDVSLHINSDAGLSSLLQTAASGNYNKMITIDGIDTAGLSVFNLKLADPVISALGSNSGVGLDASIHYNRFELKTSLDSKGIIVASSYFSSDILA